MTFTKISIADTGKKTSIYRGKMPVDKNEYLHYIIILLTLAKKMLDFYMLQ